MQNALLCQSYGQTRGFSLTENVPVFKKKKKKQNQLGVADYQVCSRHECEIYLALFSPTTVLRKIPPWKMLHTSERKFHITFKRRFSTPQNKEWLQGRDFPQMQQDRKGLNKSLPLPPNIVEP